MLFLCACLNRVTDTVSRLLFALGGAVLVCILTLTLGNIILRLFGMPVRGVIEISGYLGAAAVGLCLPRAQRTGSHIEAGMMNERLPVLPRRCLQLLTLLLSVAFMLMAASETYALGRFVREMDELIDGWGFSYDFLVFALALGCAVQALVLINDLVQAAAAAYGRSHVNASLLFPPAAGGITS